MKKLYLKSFEMRVILSLSLISLFLFPSYGTPFLNTECLSVHPIKWQEQLEYLKNKQSKTRAGISEISLIGYTHKGTLNSESEITAFIEQLFSANSVTVLYTDIYNMTFEIVPLQTIIEKVKTSEMNDPFEDLRKQLETTIKIGMELIELEWSFKNNIFYSTAIAHKEGSIIYDHIGNMLLDPIE